MSDPVSVDEWLQLVRQHEEAARHLLQNKKAASQGYWHSGMAVECALKAYIMRKERLNGWPSKAARPELYTHDLIALARIAGITLDPTDPRAPAWHVSLQWNRNQGYDPKPMPRKVAWSLFEAAFGQNGVVTWLRQNSI
jgi:hypothetical protein